MLVGLTRSLEFGLDSEKPVHLVSRTNVYRNSLTKSYIRECLSESGSGDKCSGGGGVLIFDYASAHFYQSNIFDNARGLQTMVTPFATRVHPACRPTHSVCLQGAGFFMQNPGPVILTEVNVYDHDWLDPGRVTLDYGDSPPSFGPYNASNPPGEDACGSTIHYQADSGDSSNRVFPFLETFLVNSTFYNNRGPGLCAGNRDLSQSSYWDNFFFVRRCSPPYPRPLAPARPTEPLRATAGLGHKLEVPSIQYTTLANWPVWHHYGGKDLVQAAI